VLRRFFSPKYGGGDAEITKGMRYYLENKPHYIDEAGEWWFDDKGRLYLRWDSDPNQERFELARHKVLIDLRDVRNVRIRGLAFHYTNLFTCANGASGSTRMSTRSGPCECRSTRAATDEFQRKGQRGFGSFRILDHFHEGSNDLPAQLLEVQGDTGKKWVRMVDRVEGIDPDYAQILRYRQ
jgi:hypothetical protein